MYIHNGRTQPSQLFPTQFLPGDFVGAPRTAVVVVNQRQMGRNASAPADMAGALEAALGPCESVWISVAERYDVRHMSANDMERMAYELYMAGAISAQDFILFSAPPAPLRRWYQEGEQVCHDWVAAYEGVVANCFLGNEQERFEVSTRLLEYLERLDEAAHPL